WWASSRLATSRWSKAATPRARRSAACRGPEGRTHRRPAPSPVARHVAMARRARRWLFFTAGAAVLLVALYAALGYLVAPSLIRNAFVERAAQAGLDLRLGAIAMHPFTGALDARDVELTTRAGERLANARRVTVELQFASLWRPAWLLSRVALEEPALYALPVTRRAAGQTAPAMPPVVVRELAVERGVVALPSVPRLEALQVSVRDLATLPGHDNAYNASAA